MREREDGVYKKQTNIQRATNPACGAGRGHTVLASNLWLVEVQPPSLPDVVELVSSSDSTSTAMLSSSSLLLADSGE